MAFKALFVGINKHQDPGVPELMRLGRPGREASIANIVAQFVEFGLLERQDGQVQLSLLGRACGQSCLAFDSSMRLVETIRSTSGGELTAFRFLPRDSLTEQL
jgi:hypothetical protein